MTVRILTGPTAPERAEHTPEPPVRPRWTLLPRSFRRHWHAWRHSAELALPRPRG
ncbi:hypothetical protein [Amycolatopsis thermophila]|uniref:Uncharacterized protein n=1 Tax=Amycolatopsis thermophila TaxID=206084 RepID=A0ABU0ETN1_9PSEU|nr:hypothetical protein [Amycolatopsis thermophila]MDQ0378628.1 hypothetical protein [Amycolatopsis thermophila]